MVIVTLYSLSVPMEYIESKLVPDRFLKGVTQNRGHLWCQSLHNVNVLSSPSPPP